MRFVDLSWSDRKNLVSRKHDWVFEDSDWREMLGDIMNWDEKVEWIMCHVVDSYDDELMAIKNAWREIYNMEYQERIVMHKDDFWDQDYANDLEDDLIEIKLDECTVYLKKL